MPCNYCHYDFTVPAGRRELLFSKIQLTPYIWYAILCLAPIYRAQFDRSGRSNQVI